jgi:hypothetical protein
MSANVIQLDRILARYGPETKEARDMLRRATLSLDQNWSKDTARSAKLDSSATRAAGASFYEKIQELAPRNDFQRSLQRQALQTALALGQARSLLLEQAGSSIPTPFLVVWSSGSSSFSRASACSRPTMQPLSLPCSSVHYRFQGRSF